MLLVDSLEPSDEISGEGQEWSCGVDLQERQVVERDLSTAFKLTVPSQNRVDRSSQLRLPDVENIFDESFDLFDVHHVFGRVTEQ